MFNARVRIQRQDEVGGKRVAIEGSCSDVVVRARRNLCS